ncbi:histidine kinase [Algoriphagus sp. CAU 1675]|uniref:histidine kinase n=1 Tax=Algoriphagus sp. CAU 1675 TaxID=3032597 RepID=UPI0023DCBE31|nr:histidine kinase [Algoriphagus sp. CAU 1675]MDF2159433.1 histidine kinase [Algoriphagus sp. CAU 1675]
MKAILQRFFNQTTVINGSKTAVDNAFSTIIKSPALFLWSIWSIYLLMDIGARIVIGGHFAAMEIISLNYFLGGIINQYWFFVLMPNLIFRKRWKLEFVLFIGLIAAFLFLKHYLIKDTSSALLDIRSFLTLELLRIFQFLLFTTALCGLFIFAMQQKEKSKLEIYLEHLEMEHKSLQLSPHFVLNMVSQYSASVLPLSRTLFDNLSQFTALLSYSYKSLNRQNFLSQEIRAIENYIACQNQRFADKLNFRFKKMLYGLPSDRLPIPKWTLITLVENIFKHGNCFSYSLPCMLSLNYGLSPKSKDVFTLTITNIPDNSLPGTSSGFGVEAVNRILSYHFQDHFQLFISDTSQEFNLLLYIDYGGNFKNRFTR